MSLQKYRSASGGRIDRRQTLRFYFDGQPLHGHPGDTLASALLANGISIVGRSFKYHRRRGIFGSGAEEPNALVTLLKGTMRDANLKATQVELFAGLVAYSQNRWPSLNFDLGAINNCIARLLPAGFYYKTFMWPPSWWMFYERRIRKMAGLGRAGTEADSDHYERRYAFCDVLVVGGGPTGLVAAMNAANAGARVILVDEGSEMGGGLLISDATIDDQPAAQWVDWAVNRLAEHSLVRLLCRATAIGYYDQNMIVIAERVTDHLAAPPLHLPRQRLWWVRARQVVLATGAIERPLVFSGNDRPGVMLASAAGTYARRYGIRCAIRAAVFTNNDSAYAAALALQQNGASVPLIIDSRAGGPGSTALDIAERCGIEVLRGHAVINTSGTRQGLRSIQIAPLTADGHDIGAVERNLRVDRLCVSGGWNPTVHLFSQSQGRLRFEPEIAAFVPDVSFQAERTVGAANGEFTLSDCLNAGAQAGMAAAEDGGCQRLAPWVPKCRPETKTAALSPLWTVPSRTPRQAAKRFVDLQNDVSVNDVLLATREGYESVEHLKRYTTLGMGTDQGRTSNVNGLAILAAARNTDIPSVGTTTFRPPYSPLPLGVIAGREKGHELHPIRRTALHHWHQTNGAVFVEAGQWLRPQYYCRSGEDLRQAIVREVSNVRERVGLVDVSTLGKIEVRGRDAGEFLHRMCINRIRNLRIGRCRYWFMLREDGFILDDGTATRISEHEFYVTTSTAHAAAVLAHLEFYAQTVWPELHVHLTSVTDQWAGMALSGPLSREVLQSACGDLINVSNESLAFMAATTATIAGIEVRLIRMTFSGELSYEIHVPSDYAIEVWEAVQKAGKPFGIQPYGTEAIGILRIEKGHLVSGELDGRTIPADFGFDKLQKDEDFVGKRSLERPALNGSEPRRRFVGLESLNGQEVPRGGHLIWNPTVTAPISTYGHITANCYSPTVNKHIALALIDDPDRWSGQTLYAASPLVNSFVPVRVVNSVFVDAAGKRARG